LRLFEQVDLGSRRSKFGYGTQHSAAFCRRELRTWRLVTPHSEAVAHAVELCDERVVGSYGIALHDSGLSFPSLKILGVAVIGSIDHGLQSVLLRGHGNEALQIIAPWRW
jgi:hypothetical protein